MSIKAVIWDLGGVLVRTEDPEPRRELAARFGLEPVELEHLVFDSEPGRQAQLGQITSAQLWKSVLDRLGALPGEARAIEKAFWGGDRLDDVLIDYIRGLRPRFTIALLSNAWDSLRREMEDRLGVPDVFDEIVISAEVGLMKPDKRFYRLALARIGAQPGEAVFIDDQPENVAGARSVGIQALHFSGRVEVMDALSAMLDLG